MTYAEYLSFASEISELESILEETPVTRVIDRKGLEARLNAARDALANVDPTRFDRYACGADGPSPTSDSLAVDVMHANRETVMREATFGTWAPCNDGRSAAETLRREWSR